MSRNVGQQTAAISATCADEDDHHRQRQAGELPETQRHQRQHQEQRQRHAADVVDRPLRQPDQPGRIVQVADRRGDEHRADVGGQRDADAPGEPSALTHGPDPHRDQDHDERLEQRVRLLVLARPAPPARGSGSGPRRSARRSAASVWRARAARPAQAVALDEERADRPADDAARRRCRPSPPQPPRSRRPARPPARTAGANASPVAGPPVSVTDPFSTPNSGCMPERQRPPATPITFCTTASTVASSRKKIITCGPPTRSSDRLAPKPTVVKNAIISGVCSRVSNAASVDAARPRHGA